MAITKSNSGVTLIELSIGAMLGVVLITSAVLIVVWIGKMQVYFQNRSRDDMSWIAANEHIKKQMHGASYVNISADSKTLYIYDYNGTKVGTYTNNVPINNTTGLNYQINGGGSITFENVSATFERIYPPAPKVKITEIRVNYTAPAQFASSAVLRCGVGVSNTWAIIIGNSIDNKLYDIMQTNDLGFIVLADENSISANGTRTYLIKLESDGTKSWSRRYQGANYPKSISETSNGFIFCSIGSTYTVNTITRVDTLGEIIWQKNYGSKRINKVMQTFTKKTGGVESGFVGVGTESVGGASYPGLCMLNAANGNGTSAKAIKYNNTGYKATSFGSAHYAEQTFNASGDPDGYIMGAYTYAYYNDSSALNQSIWLLRFNAAGSYVWQWICPPYPRVTSPYGQICNSTNIEKVYNSSGAPDGYIAYGGLMGNNTTSMAAVLLRLYESGGKKWSYVLSPTLQSGTFYGCMGAYKKTSSFIMNFYQNISGGQPSYTVEVDDTGAATAPKTLASPTRDNTNLFFYLATKENDGYVLGGTYDNSSGAIPGMGPHGIFIARSDLNGNCPEAADPLIICDSPTSTTNKSTSATFPAATIITVPTKPKDSLI